VSSFTKNCSKNTCYGKKKMKQFRTTYRAGKILGQVLQMKRRSLSTNDGSMKVGDSDLMPLPFEAYGNVPPEGWEDLPWEDFSKDLP
jgi:hypothetical protein